MIREHRRFSIQDTSGRGNDIEMEVNWNKQVAGNKFIKFQLAGKEAIISYNHLWTLLFMTANEKQQEDMLPTKTERVRIYNTLVDIKAKKDIKKGDTIRIPMSISQNSKGQLLIKP